MNWTNSQYEWIVSETASRGVGPYSQAIRANGLVFVIRVIGDRSQNRAFGRRCG
jgi:enamine deaminase RidA (YjgF/YER057c/UK114 family)